MNQSNNGNQTNSVPKSHKHLTNDLCKKRSFFANHWKLKYEL